MRRGCRSEGHQIRLQSSRLTVFICLRPCASNRVPASLCLRYAKWPVRLGCSILECGVDAFGADPSGNPSGGDAVMNGLVPVQGPTHALVQQVTSRCSPMRIEGHRFSKQSIENQ